jgi:beta-galactosidase
MGCNSIRTSHNPPTPELLNACDELGMLVFDETRMMSSNPEGLAQFGDLVRRDRNHPSVFMWSMGNEEAQANTEAGLHILTAMKAVATVYDGSRPVSIAPIRAIGVGGLVECDVMGYNYMDPGAEAYHKAHPEKPVIGTETVSAVGTPDLRHGFEGLWAHMIRTLHAGRASAKAGGASAMPEWLAGGFVWTGFDYRGEPSPIGGRTSARNTGLSIFAASRKIRSSTAVVVDIAASIAPVLRWMGRNGGKEIAVWVYRIDKVELFLNGKAGAKDVKKDSHMREWCICPGAIEARGSNQSSGDDTRQETTDAA